MEFGAAAIRFVRKKHSGAVLEDRHDPRNGRVEVRAGGARALARLKKGSVVYPRLAIPFGDSMCDDDGPRHIEKRACSVYITSVVDGLTRSCLARGGPIEDRGAIAGVKEDAVVGCRQGDRKGSEDRAVEMERSRTAIEPHIVAWPKIGDGSESSHVHIRKLRGSVNEAGAERDPFLAIKEIIRGGELAPLAGTHGDRALISCRRRPNLLIGDDAERRDLISRRGRREGRKRLEATFNESINFAGPGPAEKVERDQGEIAAGGDGKARCALAPADDLGEIFNLSCGRYAIEFSVLGGDPELSPTRCRERGSFDRIAAIEGEVDGCPLFPVPMMEWSRGPEIVGARACPMRHEARGRRKIHRDQIDGLPTRGRGNEAPKNDKDTFHRGSPINTPPPPTPMSGRSPASAMAKGSYP